MPRLLERRVARDKTDRNDRTSLRRKEIAWKRSPRYTSEELSYRAHKCLQHQEEQEP